MKNLIIAFIALGIISCKKDGIQPNDRKNNCKDCIVTVEKNINGSISTQSVDYTSFNSNNPSGESFCDALDRYKTGTVTQGTTITTTTIKCK